MPVIGPREGPQWVDEAYIHIMDYLKEKWRIQSYPSDGKWAKHTWQEERDIRNAEFKEALRRLFELDAWEGW